MNVAQAGNKATSPSSPQTSFHAFVVVPDTSGPNIVRPVERRIGPLSAVAPAPATEAEVVESETGSDAADTGTTTKGKSDGGCSGGGMGGGLVLAAAALSAAAARRRRARA